MDVCCVSGMHITDSNAMITFYRPAATSFPRFILRVLGDPLSRVRGHAGVRSTLNTRKLYAFGSYPSQRSFVQFGWTVLCLSAATARNADACFPHVFISPTDCITPEVKVQLYRALS